MQEAAQDDISSGAVPFFRVDEVVVTALGQAGVVV
jgi:hypothetical protein